MMTFLYNAQKTEDLQTFEAQMNTRLTRAEEIYNEILDIRLDTNGNVDEFLLEYLEKEADDLLIELRDDVGMLQEKKREFSGNEQENVRKIGMR